MNHMGTTVTDWHPISETDQKAIREQLNRILAHESFCHSRRYPMLLRHLVEQTLLGNTDKLKERLLGVEVFNRNPEYDTNSDTVVRVTAGEIRKRLAQYYYEPDHQNELRIELPSGSYVPELRGSRSELLPELNSAAGASVELERERIPKRTESSKSDLEIERIDSRPGPPRNIRFNGRAALYCTAALLLVGIVTFVAVRLYGGDQRLITDFWGPVLKSPGDAIVCIGDSQTFRLRYPNIVQMFRPGTARPDADLAESQLPPERLSAPMGEVSLISRIGSVLQRRDKDYRIVSSLGTNLSDLQQGPIVLIGAYDNQWTLRFTQELRFYTQLDEFGGHIFDRQNPSQKDWILSSDPHSPRPEDYAIIARFRDPTTGKPVVIIAGLGLPASMAAAEVVTTAEDLKSLLKDAPSDWPVKNLEAVIKVPVIDGKAGAPQTVAIRYW
jgi:hypothetical protein